MKCTIKIEIIGVLLLVAWAFPACAGHGTIQETDTKIVIEYWGDESDKNVVYEPTRAEAEAAVREANRQKQENMKGEEAEKMKKRMAEREARRAARKLVDDE